MNQSPNTKCDIPRKGEMVVLNHGDEVIISKEWTKKYWPRSRSGRKATYMRKHADGTVSVATRYAIIRLPKEEITQ